MRTVGLVDSVRGLVPGGHVCWAYQDRAEFRVRARECLVDGIALGQWVEYVGSGSAEELRDELAGLEGVGQLLDGGGIGVSPVGDFYEFSDHSGDVVDPLRAVAKFVVATEKALAGGYTGLRAVVDCTAAARTAHQRAAFARFEYLIGQQMSALPVTALCAYDLSELGRAAVAEMACLHPLASAGVTPFHLYAEGDAEFALAGELDLSCADLFATTLERIMPLCRGPELVVNGGGLEFIDHRRLLVLAEHARRANATIVLRTTWPGVGRIIGFLAVEGVRVESLV
ncbi:MAG: MEDS domain-containing protein [Pseudonocardiales bacterium]|nr:MEDS domain-containing protein [Pseudonocardiales bacterium]